MLGALSAVILMLLIKFLLDEEVGFGSAFVASLVASIVGSILIAVACGPLESLVAAVVVASVIRFVVTAVVVQVLCSTDLRGLMKVAGVYTGATLVLQIVLLVATGA